MKTFLLTAGEYYYPQWGTCDWIKTYETFEEALESVIDVTSNGDLKETTYLINGKTYDWYKIIDLKEWIGE